jgi:exonuclease SbcD
MSEPSFRFLHASDLRLGPVASAVDHPPEELIESLVESTNRAAERLFDVVVREDVDFVVLSGEVIDPAVAGVRGVLFLQSQLERLADCEIPVYWATADGDEWPQQVPLPAAVVRLSAGKSGVRGNERRGLDHLWITAIDRAGVIAEPPKPSGGDERTPFVIALRGQPIESFERMAADDSRIDYWGFGGSHRRRTLFAAKHTIAHVAGSHQGLDPSETDAHGATIVSVDDQRQSRLWFVPTDVLRWRTELIDAAESASLADVETLVQQRAASLAEDVTAVDLAVTWQLQVPVSLYAAASQPPWLRDLIGRLNQRFAVASPAAWAIAAEAIVPTDLPTPWKQRDDLRGELLRVADVLSGDHTDPIGVQESASADAANRADESNSADGTVLLGDSLRLKDAQERQQLLDEATALGASLLTAEEAKS